jgi:CheY-like chemotaxis protein
MTVNESRSEAVFEEFLEQVKQALEHLYDFPYLQQHPLAVETAESSGEAGKRLRRELIAAIEALNPGSGVSFRAPHARLYNLLHLYYVENMTILEAAYELGISERQAYRDLRRGQENIALALWNARSTANEAQRDPANMQSEVDSLKIQFRRVNVTDLLRHAIAAVEKLAAQRDIHFELEIPTEDSASYVYTDLILAQQIVVNTLSYVVRHSEPGIVTICLTSGPVLVEMRYQRKPETDTLPEFNPVAMQLSERLGWSLTHGDLEGDMRLTTLTIISGTSRILVIDDNPRFVELLTRYLTNHAYVIVAASNGADGLRMAQEVQPDVIILDVMMPEVDGWELLQRIRMNPQLEHIPILVCSVFYDPELAQSLGASMSIVKPVSQDQILTALDQLIAL